MNLLHEWLVMMTVGKAVAFVCNDEIITLSSGDVLVMDAMAVLHGVQSILRDDCDIELPLQGSRLGVPIVQARQVDPVEGALAVRMKPSMGCICCITTTTIPPMTMSTLFDTCLTQSIPIVLVVQSLERLAMILWTIG
ncbi:hypothetical protein MHU86_4314 [Fragilaria crotonensis]|nr:hypothetical protein MHU86_4314 [Fragilaria crotonensis]